jgi:hypothetical protein
MRGTLLIFHPYETRPPEVRHVNGPPTLELLKEGIGGGYLETVPYFLTIDHDGVRHNCVAFCDEEGKLKQFDHNPEATIRWDQAMRRAVGCGCRPDYLVGQIAVVFGDREFMEAL